MAESKVVNMLHVCVLYIYTYKDIYIYIYVRYIYIYKMETMICMDICLCFLCVYMCLAVSPGLL